MKKFVLFIILGFVFLFCGCKKQASYEEVIDYSFVSPVEHQVCPFEDFQLDSLWLDLTFQDGRKKRVVAEENMLDASSKEKIKQSGSYEISFELNHIKKTIPLFLYDEELLKQNTVYLLHFSDEESFINDKELLGYDIKAPANSYFYNWYLDEDFTEPFSGNQVGIISLYANFITEPTYRVRFYHQDILLKEEYVKEGENATAPAMKSLDNYVFCGWSDSFNDIKENKDIYSIYKTDVLEVEFYDFEDNLIDVE
ncbi:MAG: hypothetical protein K2J85_04725, partial [Anaeroplasmataceae bacterium]|nr:hypothetical protein [Anaeroplasmataceae bacterium]